MSEQRQYDEDLVLDKLLNSNNSILLYNDEVNTFDHVIDSLCKYCDHDSVQAEQCAWIVHNNGKCLVKSGAYDDLLPICNALKENGLSAQIH
ncbi:MAG: ATP-dependent Clp protease adaptor ClpS [Flavobacteriales bacterium]|nr:ATP-dependent Clp protease adaptor ClpS [Flavobacteriales bacterium]